MPLPPMVLPERAVTYPSGRAMMSGAAQGGPIANVALDHPTRIPRLGDSAIRLDADDENVSALVIIFLPSAASLLGSGLLIAQVRRARR